MEPLEQVRIEDLITELLFERETERCHRDGRRLPTYGEIKANTEVLKAILGSPEFDPRMLALVRKAIHKALELAAEAATLTTSACMASKGYPYGMVNHHAECDADDQYIIIDKQSILDVEKLFV